MKMQGSGLTHLIQWYRKIMKLLRDQVQIEFQVTPVYAPLQTKGFQQNLRGKSTFINN